MVDFHLKLLYSSHKNKKAPTYMLKSILEALDLITFDRDNQEYKKKALKVVELLKSNCYQKMIEIFKLHDEIKFFQQIAYKKLRENKPRDVVLIYQIFPRAFLKIKKISRVLEQFESCLRGFRG